MKKMFIATSLVAISLATGGSAYASGGKAHWGYEGEEGPANWGSLSHDYHMCKEGKHQSPIDIHGASAAKLDDIKISYKSGPKNFVNNGHTIQVNMNEGSTISVNGKEYKLLQFHFHSPSEHTIDGKPADMVAHFVHQAADGQLGVIGVLFKKGKANKTLAALWKHMPKHHGDTADLSKVKVSVAKLMPAKKAYYNYSGSLTTPPCSEGVNWMVMQKTMTVSAAQVKAFTDMFAHSVRPVQALNDRAVKSSK